MDTDHSVSVDRPRLGGFGRGGARSVPVLAAVTVALVLGAGPAPASAAGDVGGSTFAAFSRDEPQGHGVGAGNTWGDDDTNQSEHASVLGKWIPQHDRGSIYNLTRDIGAQEAWRRGITGQGVTVAVIDTGVTPVEGLDASGKVVNGPDLSYEGQRPGTRYLDGFGHGTHVAGIVAGRDDRFRARAGNPFTFAGVAPGAQVLNMKVATGDGGADVTSVIAAIDWVVQHRTDAGMNVRVISLAYGTASTQNPSIDPLAHAVENAWRHGVVVVAAAGNDGVDSSSLLMPAVDQYVIAVGASDHLGTASTRDDVVADFSSDGNDIRRPDLVAPGKSVVSLRVPKSYVDELHPEGLIDTDRGHRYLRGSGTSQATAAVSGAVALLLQQRPGLNPDQVKAVLRRSANPLTVADPAQGAGVLDVDGALDTATPAADTVRQTWPVSTGLGSLDASRAGEHVIDPSTGDLLSGQVDAIGDPFDASSWAAESSAGQAWDGGTWGTRAWTGISWDSNGWAASTWTGDSWSGLPWTHHIWSEAYWTANSWRDDSWLANSWRGGTWGARSWRESSWAANSWRDGWWSANSWRDDDWLANSWREDLWLANSWRSDDWLANSWRSDDWLANSWRSDSWVANSWRTQT